jgi:hypothetical protein
MGAHNSAVDHRIFVVGGLGEMLKHTLSDTRFGPSAEAPFHVLPVAQTLRQVAPGDAGAIAIEDGLDEQAVVRGGHANRAKPAGQQVLDPVPLVIA